MVRISLRDTALLLARTTANKMSKIARLAKDWESSEVIHQVLRLQQDAALMIAKATQVAEAAQEAYDKSHVPERAPRLKKSELLAQGLVYREKLNSFHTQVAEMSLDELSDRAKKVGLEVTKVHTWPLERIVEEIETREIARSYDEPF